jgi:hypothetical protein
MTMYWVKRWSAGARGLHSFGGLTYVRFAIPLGIWKHLVAVAVAGGTVCLSSIKVCGHQAALIITSASSAAYLRLLGHTISFIGNSPFL